MSNIYKFGTPIRLAKLAADPSGIENGVMYYNTSTNKIRSYQNGAWADITTGSVSITGQALNQNFVIIGNASNLSAAVDTSSLGDIAASTGGGLAIKSSVISDTHIAAGAAIARTKLASGTAYRLAANDASGVLSDLAAITANKALISDTNGMPIASTVTATELGYVSGVTSSIQTQFGTINTTISGLGTTYLKLDGTNSMSASLNLNSHKLLNVTTPTASSDGANMFYVDQQRDTRLALAGGSMSGNIAMNGNIITGLGAPVGANDAARLIDIQNALSGLDFQPDVIDVVLASSTAPVSPLAGDRYILTTGTLDATWGTITGRGANDIVQYNGASWFVAYDVSVKGPGALVWDTTAGAFYRWDGTTWSDFGGLAGITAGIGLSKTGNVLDVNLGAGITELPTDEVGLDLYSNAGLFLTVDGTTSSSSTSAQLMVKADNSTVEVFGGAVQLKAGGITNTHINGSAAIALSKLATVTANKALVSNGSGVIIASSVTDTELGYLSGVTSAIQTQLGTKANLQLSNLSGTTAIPVALLPDASGTRTLGSLAASWSATFSGVYRGSKVSSITSITTNGTSSVTMASTTGLVANSTVIFSSLFANGYGVVTSITNGTTVVVGNTGTVGTGTDATASITYSNSVRTEDDATANLASGTINLRSGNTGTGRSGYLNIKSGDSSGGGTTGDVFIKSGSTSGTRGSVILDASAIVIKPSDGLIIGNGSTSTAEVSINVNVATLSANISSATDIGANATLTLAMAKSTTVEYEIVEASTGNVRNGTLKIASTAAGVAALNDSYVETATVGSGTGIEFTLRYDSGNGLIWIQYNNTSSNACTMKLFQISPLASVLY